MTLLDLMLSTSAVSLTAASIAYTLRVVRTNMFERPSDAQIKHMIETVPRGKFDNALAR